VSSFASFFAIRFGVVGCSTDREISRDVGGLSWSVSRFLPIFPMVQECASGCVARVISSASGLRFDGVYYAEALCLHITANISPPRRARVLS